MSGGKRVRPVLRAVLFDLDGTLTRPRSSWQWIHEELGLWEGQADRYQIRFQAGEISYEEFCRLDALLWRGMPVERLRRICDRIPYHEGAVEMAAALHGAGLIMGIVSTGLTLLADRVREELGLQYAAANDLEVREGRLTGGVRILIPHGGKDRALHQFCATFDLDPCRVAAVGDTEGDLSMFGCAGWSVAFNAADRHVEGKASVAASGTDLRALIPLLLPRA